MNSEFRHVLFYSQLLALSCGNDYEVKIIPKDINIWISRPLPSKVPEFMMISNSKVIGSIPSLVVYMVVLFGIFYYLMRFTSFGRNCYAIGGNYEVAKYSGIKVVPIKWTAFVISGITAALAGVLLASRMNTGSSVYGDTTGMLVNCGVVIGGTSFAGGVGGIRESFIGLFVIQMLTNVMSMLGLDSYYQKLFEGILIVLIIGLDCFVRMRKRERV
jgi:ribose transport system permease protein